jgi:hypothetical protein
LKLDDEQKMEFTLASESATWARQNDPEQNPKLIEAYKNIEAQTNDSEEEYSSDEDPMLIHPTIYGDLERKLKDGKMGKTPVIELPSEFTYSEEKFKEQEDWILEQQKGGGQSQSDEDEEGMSD